MPAVSCRLALVLVVSACSTGCSQEVGPSQPISGEVVWVEGPLTLNTRPGRLSSEKGPISGARILISAGEREWSTLTDQDGRFGFDEIEVESGTRLRVEVSRPGFAGLAIDGIGPLTSEPMVLRAGLPLVDDECAIDPTTLLAIRSDELAASEPSEED